MSSKAENPVGVPPGTFDSDKMVRIEDVMNATIRECVFVTEFLDSGDIESAMDALLQIKMNAESIAALVQGKEEG